MKTVFSLFLIFILAAHAQAYEMQCLNGDQTIDSAQGVLLCQKQGENTFVQMVDLGAGAKLKLMHNEITGSESSSGTFGAPNPIIRRKDIRDIWSEKFEWQENAFSLSNGAFYGRSMIDHINYNVPLSFPLIINSQLISGGNESPEEFDADGLRMLELWDNHAQIHDVRIDPIVLIFDQSNAPNVIVGKNGNAEPASAEDSTGRTMVGIAGDNNEILIIMVAEDKTIAEGAQILLDYGVPHEIDDPHGKQSQIIRLDGSGSSQLMNEACTENICAPGDGRNIPQTIGVFSSNALCERLNEPIPNPGLSEKFKIYKNVGYLSYNADRKFLVLDPENTGYEVMGKTSNISYHKTRDFIFSGTKAYLALDAGGMDILDISENCNPQFIKRLKISDIAPLDIHIPSGFSVSDSSSPPIESVG